MKTTDIDAVALERALASYGKTSLIDDRAERLMRTYIRRILKHHNIIDGVVEADLLALMKTAALASAKPAQAGEYEEVLLKVLWWAEHRCPCENEQPNPCPLCGASVENLEACKSAENTLPRELLDDLRRVAKR